MSTETEFDPVVAQERGHTGTHVRFKWASYRFRYVTPLMTCCGLPFDHHCPKPVNHHHGVMYLPFSGLFVRYGAGRNKFGTAIPLPRVYWSCCGKFSDDMGCTTGCLPDGDLALSGHAQSQTHTSPKLVDAAIAAMSEPNGPTLAAVQDLALPHIQGRPKATPERVLRLRTALSQLTEVLEKESVTEDCATDIESYLAAISQHPDLFLSGNCKAIGEHIRNCGRLGERFVFNKEVMVQLCTHLWFKGRELVAQEDTVNNRYLLFEKSEFLFAGQDSLKPLAAVVWENAFGESSKPYDFQVHLLHGYAEDDRLRWLEVKTTKHASSIADFSVAQWEFAKLKRDKFVLVLVGLPPSPDCGFIQCDVDPYGKFVDGRYRAAARLKIPLQQPDVVLL